MIDEKELIKILVDYKSDKWNRELYASLPSVVDDCIDFVESQPKIGEWIPCDELPEENKSDELYTQVIVQLKNGTVGTGCYRSADKEWWGDFLDVGYRNITEEIIAWQPLPDPYQSKGGKECDENATD